jgi:hypothetical protein
MGQVLHTMRKEVRMVGKGSKTRWQLRGAKPTPEPKSAKLAYTRGDTTRRDAILAILQAEGRPVPALELAALARTVGIPNLRAIGQYVLSGHIKQHGKGPKHYSYSVA